VSSSLALHFLHCHTPYLYSKMAAKLHLLQGVHSKQMFSVSPTFTILNQFKFCIPLPLQYYQLWCQDIRLCFQHFHVKCWNFKRPSMNVIVICGCSESSCSEVVCKSNTACTIRMGDVLHRTRSLQVYSIWTQST
jgi:hypothetical protein